MSALNDIKQNRLESAIRLVQQRWGSSALVPARSAPTRASLVPTGLAALDQLLEGGVPLRAITLFTGGATSGKLTVAYKILSQTQQGVLGERRRSVAIVDLGASTDPDYIMRSGVDLDRLLLIRPQAAGQAVRVLLDLVRSRALDVILVDCLSDLSENSDAARALEQMMPQVNLALRTVDCALIFLEDAQSPWLPWLPTGSSRAVHHYASLHVEFTRQEWIESASELCGYRVQARLMKSRGPRSGTTVSFAIELDRTVRARETW